MTDRMKGAVYTVSSRHEDEFERNCNSLVEQGYLLFSAGMNFATSDSHSNKNCLMFWAIFVKNNGILASNK